jgi:hypothetical protein
VIWFHSQGLAAGTPFVLFDHRCWYHGGAVMTSGRVVKNPHAQRQLSHPPVSSEFSFTKMVSRHLSTNLMSREQAMS